MDTAYLDGVQKLSSGNPLFVKLLMEDLIEGRRAASDVTVLPGSIRDLFEGILRRIERTAPEVIDVLVLLAYAKEQLSAAQLARLAGCTIVAMRNALEAV